MGNKGLCNFIFSIMNYRIVYLFKSIVRLSLSKPVLDNEQPAFDKLSLTFSLYQKF